MAIRSKNPILGIIGGSGIYDIEGIKDIRIESILSPFGAPSDDLVFGNLMGQEVVFLQVAQVGQYRIHTNRSVSLADDTPIACLISRVFGIESKYPTKVQSDKYFDTRQRRG